MSAHTPRIRLEEILDRHKRSGRDRPFSCPSGSSSLSYQEFPYSLSPDNKDSTRSPSPSFKYSGKEREKEREKGFEKSKEKEKEGEDKGKDEEGKKDKEEENELDISRGNKKDEREREKDKYDRSDKNKIYSMASSTSKKGSMYTENSRGVAVSEILLYLPLSSLHYIPPIIDEKSSEKDEKENYDLINITNNNSNFNSNFNSNLNSNNQSHSNISNTDTDIYRYKTQSVKSDTETDIYHAHRKNENKADNLNLLTRAALALSR